MTEEISHEARQKKIPYALMFGLVILFSTVIIIIIISDYDRIIEQLQHHQMLKDFPELKEILKIINKNLGLK